MKNLKDLDFDQQPFIKAMNKVFEINVPAGDPLLIKTHKPSTHGQNFE